MAAVAAGLHAAVLRVLFLGMLAVGVIGMHTVGHADAHDGWAMLSSAGGTTGHMTPAAYTSQVADAPGRGDPCDQDQCLGAGRAPMSDDPGPARSPGGTGVVVICLAVFFGTGLLALLAAALSRRRHSAALPRGWRARYVPRRARRSSPPWLTLRLVEVAVLRT